MADIRPLLVALILSALPLSAEYRFGLKVAQAKLSASQFFSKIDGNQFVNVKGDDYLASTIVYGGPQRYFVEVKITNEGMSKMEFDRRFVTMLPSENILSLSTEITAAEIQLQKAIIPKKKFSEPKVNAQLRELLDTIESNREQKRLQLANMFASHLLQFSHESQSLSLDPGESRLYIFVFRDMDWRKKKPIVQIRVHEQVFLVLLE